MPSSEFIGIIPAAGGGTRLGLPYPKELHSVEPGVLYVDYSLMQLREAGIKEAFVVTTSAKLGDLAKALMYERHGVKLHYVEVQPTDSKSLVGSVLRGCRRAEYRLEYEKFVVVLPDSKFGDHQAVKKLVEHGHEPSFLAFDCPDPSQFDSIYVQ